MLPQGRRPAAAALDAFVSGKVPDVDTAVSLTSTRIALLAQDSADNEGVLHRWGHEIHGARCGRYRAGARAVDRVVG